MPKIIRLTTKNAPLFDHAGLKLRDGQWIGVDLEELEQDGKFAIEKYRDTIVMVHPHDEALYVELVAANAAARGDKAKPATPSAAAAAPKPSKKEQA